MMYPIPRGCMVFPTHSDTTNNLEDSLSAKYVPEKSIIQVEINVKNENIRIRYFNGTHPEDHFITKEKNRYFYDWYMNRLHSKDGFGAY